MRKLLKHEFEANSEVDGERATLAARADELFADVMACAGEMKRNALKAFDAHNKKVQSLLERNRGYFAQKRAYLLEGVVLNHSGEPASEEALNGVKRKRGAKALATAVGVLLLLQGCAMAYTPHQVVLAVIGEAEGEPQTGKEAVACAIRNRGTLKGVYGLHAPRVVKRLYSAETYDNVVDAYWSSQDQGYCEGLIHGAQYWEGTGFPTPYWAKKMVLTATIGHQRFYRKEM